MVTVYTNPSCVQCDMTKKFLNNKNIPYETVDLSTDQKALDLVLSYGFKAAPVVVTPTDKWSGFKVDKLNGLLA